MSRTSHLIRTLCASAFISAALSTALPNLTYAQAASAAAQALPAGAMAVVNGVQIPQSALDDAVRTAMSSSGAPDSPQLRAALKEQLIVREVLRQQAERAHYDQRPEVAQAAADQKVDVEIRAWMQDNVHTPEPTERQIRARYNSVNAELGKYEYKPQFIVLADQTVAQDVLKQALAGQPFDALARQYSIVPSKANGGEMPWVSFKTPVVEGKTRGVPVDVARVLAQLPVGGVSPQPVRSGAAWVIVKLEDKRPNKVQPLGEVRDQIRREIMAESMDAGAAKLVKSLVQNATIVQ
jgi:peptidyl-prolyl cis-trans isomerase C